MSLEARNESRNAFTESAQSLAKENQPVDPAAANQLFNDIWQTGAGEERHFHNNPHYQTVSSRNAESALADSDIMQAVRLVFGFGHDWAQTHVDAKRSRLKGQQDIGISEQHVAELSDLVRLEPDGERALRFHFREDIDDPELQSLLNATRKVFDYADDNPAILPVIGRQNELLSALYMLKRAHEMGLEPKYILAGIAMIEGTFPFQDSQRFPELRNRLVEANALLANPLTPQEIDDAMTIGAEMANTDVGDFRLQDFASFVANSRRLLAENIQQAMTRDADGYPDFSQANPEKLIEAMHKMLFLEGVRDANTANIFHTQDGSTHPDEAIANQRISELAVYLKSNMLAIAAALNAYEADHGSDSRPDTMQALLEGIDQDMLMQPWGQPPINRPKDSQEYEVTQQLAGAMAQSETPLPSDRLAAAALRALGADGITEIHASGAGVSQADIDAQIRNLKYKARQFLGERLMDLEGEPNYSWKPGSQNNRDGYYTLKPDSRMIGGTAELSGKVDERTLQMIEELSSAPR